MTRAALVFAALMCLAVGISHFDTRADVAQVCAAKNKVTRELNARVRAHKADSDGLVHLAEQARTAHLADYGRTGSESDRVAAERMQGIIVDVKSKARYTILPLEKC